MLNAYKNIIYQYVLIVKGRKSIAIIFNDNNTTLYRYIFFM